MKQILTILLLVFLLSGCSTIKGISGINTTENQIQIEKSLIKDTKLEKQNITIKNSIVTTINNLEQLQIELIKLNHDIEHINYELNSIANNKNLNSETIDYLNNLNELLNKSNLFVNALQNSTNVWNNYLVKQNTSNLNFTNNDTENQNIINTIEKPLEVFK